MKKSSFKEGRPSCLGSFCVLGEWPWRGHEKSWICYDVDAKGPLHLLMARTLSPESSFDSQAFEELKDEARLVSRSRHPGLPWVEAVGSDGGHSYIICHLVEGGSFADVLRSPGRLPMRVGVRVLLDILEAYGAAIAAAGMAGDRISLYHQGVELTFPPTDGQVS